MLREQQDLATEIPLAALNVSLDNSILLSFKYSGIRCFFLFF